MDERLEQLRDWLRHRTGHDALRLEPASSDASFRRYFRVYLPDGTTRIAMDAPPEHEDSAPFVAVGRLFEGLGVHVPRIHEVDLEAGFLLLGDLGDRQYLAELDETRVDALYGDALEALLRIQRCPAAERDRLPPYDHALLMREMGLFRDWFLGHHLGLVLDPETEAGLAEAFELLAAEALAQPRVCVHRDYHSRNLMLAEPNPGVLDFQDAVAGPVTYDLVSLLRDCYIAWPRTRVEAWARRHHQRLLAEGVLDDVDAARFLHWFDLMGVQRHLKAIGIFARLNIRDGKPGYLGDIPRTLGYVREVAARYPALAAFRDFIEGEVVPRLDETGRRRGDAS